MKRKRKYNEFGECAGYSEDDLYDDILDGIVDDIDDDIELVEDDPEWDSGSDEDICEEDSYDDYDDGDSYDDGDDW